MQEPEEKDRIIFRGDPTANWNEADELGEVTARVQAPSTDVSVTDVLFSVPLLPENCLQRPPKRSGKILWVLIFP